MSTRVGLALGIISLFSVACGGTEEAASVEAAVTPAATEEVVAEDEAPEEVATEEVAAEDEAPEEAATEDEATEEVVSGTAAIPEAAAVPGNNSNPMEGVEAGHGADRVRSPTNVNRMRGGSIQNQNQGD
jgi:hypothetical protein